MVHEYDPLWDPAAPDLHVSENVYDAQGRLVAKRAAADVAGGERGETRYTYVSLR